MKKDSSKDNKYALNALILGILSAGMIPGGFYISKGGIALPLIFAILSILLLTPSTYFYTGQILKMGSEIKLALKAFLWIALVTFLVGLLAGFLSVDDKLYKYIFWGIELAVIKKVYGVKFIKSLAFLLVSNAFLIIIYALVYFAFMEIFQSFF